MQGEGSRHIGSKWHTLTLVRGVAQVIEDPARLAGLRRLVLLDTPTSESFDRLTRMAARLLCAPMALVTLIDADRQWFKSAHGLPEPLATDRQTALAYSVCQYVVAAGRPLTIDDALADTTYRRHPAVVDFGIRSYAGMPLFSPDGLPVGALCVLDVQPRSWTDEDLLNLEDLAAIATREIALHVHDRIQAHRRVWSGIDRRTT